MDSPERETPPPPTDFAVKLLNLLDLSIELGTGNVESEGKEIMWLCFNLVIDCQQSI